METAGWILLVWGGLSFFGCLIGGSNPTGPILFIVIGAYCLHVHERRLKEKAEKEKWEK